MNNRLTNSLTAILLGAASLMWVAFDTTSAQASTVWTGPNTNFTQTVSAPMDILVSNSVAISRQPGSFLYNPYVDLFGPGEGTPSGTEWAFGTVASHGAFESFSQIRADGAAAGQHVGQYIVGKAMVLHLINEDILISLTFTAWPMFGGSTFTYNRSTPAAVVPPPPTPSVTITNPTEGAVFSSPANVTIRANATVTSGSVTNVQFFANAGSLGSKQTAPFNFTANGLTTGSYALKAVATAGGISATSAVVNISVVSPVTTSLAAPSATPNNEFSFTYSATPGLTYAVDVSSNLFNWTPLATNVAASNPVSFTNAISGDGNYYRVRLLPNP